MDNYPSTNFVVNLQTEANRVLHTMVQTVNGFYFTHKFAVLPHLEKYNATVVHLPELKYEQLDDLWEKLSKISDLIPLEYPEDQVKKVEQLLPPPPDDLTETKLRFQKEWLGAEKNFWQFINGVMPNYTHNIESIEVRITQYGSKISFDRVSATKKQLFKCYLRYDMTIANLAEAIIQGLLYAENETHPMSWEAREAVADFLIQQLVEKNLFKEFKPTLETLNNQSEELFKASKTYLARLGFHFEKPITKENNLIYLNNKVVSARLTSIQHLILSLLIDKENQIVSYDELGDIIWSQEDNFSIWAINKNMQRLRTKLISLGANPNCIQPCKGKGYSLNN